MSEYDFGQPTGPDDGWPFDKPDPDHSNPDLGAEGTSSRARPYAEWYHDEAAHGDAGLWGYPQDTTPPVRWPGQYSPGEPAPRRASEHRRTRRFPWRPVTITVLLAAVIAAVTVVTFPSSGSGSEAGPGASSTSGTGVMVCSRHAPPTQRPAVTKRQAEQVLSHYWKVSNEANEQRSDCLLGAIEADSSPAASAQ